MLRLYVAALSIYFDVTPLAIWHFGQTVWNWLYHHIYVPQYTVGITVYVYWGMVIIPVCSFTGDCGIFVTWKRIANHIRAVTFTNQNPWNGLHVSMIPQSPVMSPIPRVLIGGRDPPLCFTCCKDSAISCNFLPNGYQATDKISCAAAVCTLMYQSLIHSVRTISQFQRTM